jgi:hypothetical protein
MTSPLTYTVGEKHRFIRVANTDIIPPRPDLLSPEVHQLAFLCPLKEISIMDLYCYKHEMVKGDNKLAYHLYSFVDVHGRRYHTHPPALDAKDSRNLLQVAIPTQDDSYKASSFTIFNPVYTYALSIGFDDAKRYDADQVANAKAFLAIVDEMLSRLIEASQTQDVGFVTWMKDMGYPFLSTQSPPLRS